MTRTVFANGRNFSYKGSRGGCRMSDVSCLWFSLPEPGAFLILKRRTR